MRTDALDIPNHSASDSHKFRPTNLFYSGRRFLVITATFQTVTQPEINFLELKTVSIVITVLGRSQRTYSLNTD